ncbi:MAG: thioesterase family protein [Alphaproteobacteria bacterium]|nr:thioesterase family protein [Alphaproteobacteria bacterium]
MGRCTDRLQVGHQSSPRDHNSRENDMNLWLRLCKVILSSFLRPKLRYLDHSHQQFMVWPNDLDFNLHMNNARYLAVMDLGRVDLILRTELGRVVYRHHLKPLLASVMVRFRRPLAPFQGFTLVSRVIGWDTRWTYIEHRIESRGALVCLAIAKVAFLGKNGLMPTTELMALMGVLPQSLPLPEWLITWAECEDKFYHQAESEPRP